MVVWHLITQLFVNTENTKPTSAISFEVFPLNPTACPADIVHINQLKTLQF